MAYQGRVVLLGNYEDKPFAGFVLASRSEQERELKRHKNRISIVPTEAALLGVVRGLRDGNLSVLENYYPCVNAFEDKYSSRAAVAFNGRFGNIVERCMKRGDILETAMKKALDAANPKPDDPRFGAIVHMHEGKPNFYFGVFDIKQPQLYLVREVLVGRNQAKYITLNSPDAVQELALNGSSLDGLAERLFHLVLGEAPEAGIGAGACILDGNEFRFDVFNAARK